MALIVADAIQTRLREVLQAGLASVRAISSSRFQGDLPPGLDATEERRRGVVDEKPIEIELGLPKPHPQRFTVAGNRQIWLLDATVKIVRTVALEEQVDDTLRDAVRAQTTIDGSAIADALEWPNNLATTSGAVATGIIGARYLGGTAQARGVAGEAMDITATHRIELTVKTSPATT